MKRIAILLIATVMLAGITWAQALPEEMVDQAREAIKISDLTGADQLYKDAMNGTADEDEYAEIRKEWEELEGINILLADGRRAIDRQDYPEALKKYTDAIAAMESAGNEVWFKVEAEALYSMGMVYYKQEQPIEAAEQFRSAMALDAAEDKYGKAIEMVRNKHYSEGHKLYKRKDYGGAYGEYEKAVAVDPSFSSAYYMLALIEKREGRLSDAERSYQAAVQYDPTHYKSWYGLGLMYSDKGQDSKAIEMFQRAIDVNPDYEKALYAIAKVYDNQKKTEQAINALKKAIAIDKKYSNAYELLAKIYIDGERMEETVALLAKLSGPAATNTTYYRLAHAQNALGNYSEALTAANRSLAKKSNWAPALIEKGDALAGLKNKSEAIAAFKAASKDARWKSLAEYRIAELTKWQNK